MAAKHKRIPPTRYAWAIEKSYQRALNRLVKQWRRIPEYYLRHVLKQYIKGGTQMLTDAAHDTSWVNYVQQQLNLMSVQLETQQSDTELGKTVDKFLFSIDKFSATNVQHQVKAARVSANIQALDPIGDDDAIKEYLAGKRAENVGLIKSFRSDYADSLRNDILRTITNRGGVGDVTAAIVKRSGMAVNHAALIANDQTGTILSQLDAYRCKKAGAEKYVWRSMEDDRVRPKHQELDGQTFRYDDPNGGDDGDLPGEPIRCRCVAEAVF